MIQPTRYFLNSNDAGILTEVYFPKRAAYQGAIFSALRTGFYEQQVIDYLQTHAAALLEELRDWSEILDPLKYTDAVPPPRPALGVDDARARIQMYRSVFKGYSMYTVDGVFFSDQTQTIYEEATQVVRLVFRFECPRDLEAADPQYKDILRSLCYWLVNYKLRLDHHYSWAPTERERFLAEHRHWPAPHRDYAAAHFEAIAKQVEKWADDCGLFILGFLVRKFSENVLQQNLLEEEIWVVSSFDSCINVVKRCTV